MQHLRVFDTPAPSVRVLPGTHRPDTLGDRVRRRLDETFKGRERELERIDELLADVDALPRMLAITGPPGIGKTALARAAQRRQHRRGTADVVIVDAHEFDRTAAGLDALVATRTSDWPRKCGDRPLLLVIDAFEIMSIPERRRLREDFLADLSGPVLLALCDRSSVNGRRCQLVGWRSVEERMPLGPLAEEDGLAFAAHQGLNGAAARQAVLLSAGNPLLLTVAGELASHLDEGSVPVRAVVEVSAGLIVSRLRREGVDDFLLPLVEVASLLPSVSEETLSAVLQRDVAALFPRLLGLSVVAPIESGHAVTAPFARILADDLRLRRPRWCATVAARAGAAAGSTHRDGVPASPLAQPASPVRSRDPRPDPPPCALDEIKRALEWIRDPSRHPGAGPAACLGLTDGDGERGRQALVDVITSLTESDSVRVAEAGFVLRDYYLRGAGSLEAVAERMGVSRATLFRRLALGIQLVATRAASPGDRRDTYAVTG